MKICRLCNKEFPSSVVIEGKRIVFSSRKYCLDCSPYNTHNTKVLEGSQQGTGTELSEKFCRFCESVLPLSEFYTKREGKGVAPYCKKCSNLQSVERQRRLKREAVEYKGGSCQRCGYDKCYGALEFHHRNPLEKDFAIAHQKCTTMNDKIKSELDKCDLLCKNCHAEVHWLLGS